MYFIYLSEKLSLKFADYFFSLFV